VKVVKASPARPSDPKDRLIGDLQAKLQKQRNEIGRLTRVVAALESDKRALRFDLHKAQARITQLTETIKEGGTHV
jgi:chromosome segregation ATPase